jgi:hypothetical protein
MRSENIYVYSYDMHDITTSLGQRVHAVVEVRTKSSEGVSEP